MLFYPSFKDNTFKLVEKKIIFLLLFSIKIVNNYYYPKLYKPLFSSGRLGRQVVLDTWLSASRLQLASFLEMSNIWSTLHTASQSKAGHGFPNNGKFVEFVVCF